MGGLSRSTVRALCQFLHAHREGWLLESRLATAARMAAEDAHRQGLAPDRMLAALEGLWVTLDEVLRLPVPERQALLGRLVTMSVRAYDRPGRASASREATDAS